jgi:hypothetical protein
MCQPFLITFLRYAMLPAPTSIAAPPSPKSRGSWNPAVPPPPVGGAAVGNGLADGLRVADGDGDGLRVADGLRVPGGDAGGLALGVVTLAVPLGKAGGVAEALTAGEDVGSAAEGEDVVQAETAAEVSMVKVPQPMAVNLAPSPVPAVLVRTFMEPPNASGRWRPRYPVPPQKQASEGNEWPSPSLTWPADDRSPKAPRAIKVKPIDGTDMQWPFTTGISGYASRTPWGRRREGRWHWARWSGGV